jgi:hypothetical protein
LRSVFNFLVFALAIIGVLFVALTMYGNFVGSSSIAADGYDRVQTPAGCYSHTESRDRNVRLSPELEGELNSLLGDGGLSDVRCWYEQPDSGLLLTIGDECGPHQAATFQRVGKVWTLRQKRDVPIGLCDERKQ